jgi:ABC-type Fe3+ transport system permease subunit
MTPQSPRPNHLGLLVQSVPITILVLLSCLLALPILFELVGSLTLLLTSRSEADLGQVYLSTSRLMLLSRSILIAGLIGLIGVCMGIPMARIVLSARSRRHQFLVALLITPLWLPSTLIYAAGNLLRAPDTILGRVIISFSTSSDDLRWVTIYIGYAIAVFGLAIWSAPIAGLLIASGIGHKSSQYDDMVALEPIGILKRGLLWIRLHLRAIFQAWILTSILMLGSATAMHLAQLETWSIVIWRQLAERSQDQWGTVWISSWPMLIVAIIGARLITKKTVSRSESHMLIDQGYRAARIPRLVVFFALVVFTFGALVPMLSMLFTLDDWGSIIHFWRLQSTALRDSGLLALATGVMTILVALLVAVSLGHASQPIRRIAALCVMVCCVLGLLPGVLIGAAVIRSPISTLGSPWITALIASSIRTVFLGAIIGALCASSESLDRKHSRWQIAGGSLRAWVLTMLPSVCLPILASGLVGFLYALYEIEASIMVRPPGMENLPQQLLSDLHYVRLEQLSASGINLLVIGLVLSLLASWMMTKLGSRDEARSI